MASFKKHAAHASLIDEARAYERRSLLRHDEKNRENDVKPEQDPDQLPDILPGGWKCVFILTGINCMNYMDRYIPSAVKKQYQTSLGLADWQTSFPLTSFLGYSRPRLIFVGVLIWCASSVSTVFFLQLSDDHEIQFIILVACRSVVGIGEAAYSVIAPVLISNYFCPSKRNMALAIFYMAIPVGGAIGFALGGVMASLFGWRYAFFLSAPGILFGLAALTINDPGPVFDEPKHQRAQMSWPQALKSLASNPLFVVTVAGMVANTWAAGGLADWLPTFLQCYDHVTPSLAGLIVGASAVVGGLGGTTLGGVLAEKVFKGRTRNPYLATASLCMIPATLIATGALFVRVVWIAALMLSGGQLFLWCYTAPTNALIANCVPAECRSRAFAISNVAVHALGDAISPTIIGALGHKCDILQALYPAPVMVAVGGIIWGFGWRFCKPIEEDKHHSRRLDQPSVISEDEFNSIYDDYDKE